MFLDQFLKRTISVGFVLFCGDDLVAKSCSTLVTPRTVALQVSVSMGFPRQEYWRGLPFPSPGDLSDPGIESRSPALQADSTYWATNLVFTLLQNGCFMKYIFGVSPGVEWLRLSTKIPNATWCGQKKLF